MCTVLTNRSLIRSSNEHPQAIHSGHFMVSNLDDSESDAEETDFFSADDETKQSSTPVKVESMSSNGKSSIPFEELGSLFKYLEIACTGKLTSPKWNRFRGLRFPLKNTIRLNNIIWREYHMQFMKHLRPYAVYFQSPFIEKPAITEFFQQTILLEGKYWIRRMNSIRTEYCGWRIFGRKHNTNFKLRRKYIADLLGPPYPFSRLADGLHGILSPGDIDATFASFMNDNLMDFDDNLDLLFEKPFNLPLTYLGAGDLVQPGLTQFEPDDVDEPMLSFQTSSVGSSLFNQNRNVFQDLPLKVSGSVATPSCGQPNALRSGSLESFPFCAPANPTVTTTAESLVSRNAYIVEGGYVQKPTASLNELEPSANSSFSYDTVGIQRHDDAAVQYSAFDRRDKERGLVRVHAKHGHQQSGTSGRRISVAKRYRPATSGRHRLNPSYVTTPSDRTLKNKFRVNYFDSSGLDYDRGDVTSETPALLSSLLQDENTGKITSAIPYAMVPTPDNASRSTCSTPILCSALTSPHLERTSMALALPNHIVPRPSNDLQQLRPCKLDASRCPMNGTMALVTNSVKHARQSDNFRDSLTKYHPESKLFIQGAHEPFRLPSAVGSRVGSDESPSSFPTNKESPDILVRASDSLAPSTGTLLPQHSRLFDSSAYVSLPVATSPMACPPQKSVAACSFSQSCATISDGTSFPMPYEYFKPKTDSTKSTFETDSMSRTLSFERSWNNVDRFSRSTPSEGTSSCRPSRVPISAKRSEFFPTSVQPESSSTFASQNPSRDDKSLTDRNLVEGTCTLHGRCCSAGSLFAFPQALVSHQSKSEVMPNYSATDSLSSRMSSHPTVTSTSPSYSPSGLDGDLNVSTVITGHSSEERRRQSMQASLETLRHMIRMYGTMSVGSRGHFDDCHLSRKNSSHDVFYLDAESTSEELVPTMKKPSPLAGSEGMSEESIWTSGHEASTSVTGGSGRASNAATLRESAELIKRLRDMNADLDSKRKSLLNEIAALESTNAAHWEQLCPSGRPLTESQMPADASIWFAQHVHGQTESCWKFYLFSLLLEELFQTYYTTVNATSKDHFVRSIHTWLDQHCTAAQLRPALVRALCKLTTTTSALHDLSQLPDQARQAAAERLSSQLSRSSEQCD